ncbi:MAG TPA: hypothetical protein VIN36_04805 [Thiobacillus sp.]
MKQRPIRYEPHPVSPERKAELQAAGYQIIDARFGPAAQAPAESGEAPRRRKNKGERHGADR